MNNNQIKTLVDQTIEIQELKKTIQDLTAELEEYRSIAENVGAAKAVSKKEKLEKIINDTLIELPEIFIVDHIPESIPEIVRYWIRSYAEEYSLREKWEELADNLIVFAKIVREVEGNATRNTEYYNSAYEAIEQYEKLKDANR